MHPKQITYLMSSTHLNHQKNWINQLETVSSLGFDGIEIFGTDFVSGSLTRNKVIHKIKEFAENLNLELTAHPWFDFQTMEVDRAVAEFDKVINRCDLMGVKKINVHLNFFASEKAGSNRVVKIIQPLLEEIEKNNQELFFENVPINIENPLGSTINHFLDFFNRLHHSKIGFTLDVGHALISNNLDVLTEELKDKWKYTHINDNSGINDEHLGPGMGKVDWEGFAYLVNHLNYKYPLVMEFPESHLANCLPVLKSAFKKQGLPWMKNLH
ncbi:MAG: sugar phosphate isomerase/epimerase family protein [Halanaerobiaceae bacterium]